MGIIISRFRKKKTTIEQLEDIEQKIQSIEKFKEETEQQFRRVIGKFVLSSITIYLIALVVYYYYFSPNTFRENIFKFMPLLVFPIAIYLIRRILSWYFKRKLSKNEVSLKNLKVNKKKMLDEVMDKEVYKVAKEILEKFAPEQLNKDKPINTNMKAIMPSTPRSDMLPRQRIVNSPKPPAPLPDIAFQAVPNSNQLQPRLSLPRPVLPRHRGAFDKLIDMVVGDGPGNRYALICRMCSSHNGMALKHEFEYLAFRCAYCLQWNPARKQRPHAPNLVSDTGSQDESDANTSEIDPVNSPAMKAENQDEENSRSQTENTNGDIDSNGDTDKVAHLQNGNQSSEKVPDIISSFDMADLKAAVDEVEVDEPDSETTKSNFSPGTETNTR